MLPTRLLLAALLVLLPACAMGHTRVNEPLDASAIATLRPGTTTAGEVVERLGAPLDVVQLGKRSAYRYEFSSTKRAVLWLLVVALWNEDSRADRAWLFFDEDQVLSHVGASLEGRDTEYAMPWEDVHD